MLADDLHLVVAAFRPAHIHALQHLRPVLALGAAGAGMNLDIGVVGVGLAGEQRLDLPGVGLLAQRGPAPSRPRRRRCSSPSSSPRATISIWSSSSRTMRSKALSDVSSCWRSRIRLWARRLSLQKFGASASRSSSASLCLAWSGSKMPPEQGQGLSDVVDHRLGFGAHRFLKLLWMDGTDRRASLAKRPTQVTIGSSKGRRYPMSKHGRCRGQLRAAAAAQGEPHRNRRRPSRRRRRHPRQPPSRQAPGPA